MAKIVYRAKQGMVCSIKGQRFHFSSGDLVFEDHPVKPKGHANFEEISEYVERITTPRHRGVVIEQATAEPGERRSLGRPAKKAAAKKSSAEPSEPAEPTNADGDGSDEKKDEGSDGQE